MHVARAQCARQGYEVDSDVRTMSQFAEAMKQDFDRVHRINGMDTVILIFSQNEFNTKSE